MTKIKPQDVGNIIRWHDGAAIGRNYEHGDMHVKYLILVASWKAFKQGIASRGFAHISPKSSFSFYD